MLTRGSDISGVARSNGPFNTEEFFCSARAGDIIVVQHGERRHYARPPSGQPFPAYDTASPAASRTGKYLRTRSIFAPTARAIISAVRHNPSTVVVLAGKTSEQLLAAVERSMNVVLVRPAQEADGVEAAVAALRRASGISAPYVLVVADPLAAVAAEWSAMWDLSSEPRGSDRFELRAAEALGAWRANQFELPDYYLVLTEQTGPSSAAAPATPEDHRPDFYLGPLRSVRPHRVAVAAAAEPAAQAAALLSELGSLRTGRWWPSLEDIFGTVRGFYPGALTESPDAGRATLLA